MMRSRRRVVLLLLFWVVVSVIGPGPVCAAIVQPSVAESGSVIVTAATAEVREGPSPDSNIITVVEQGEIFLKQGRTGGWYYIRINGDAFGWISGRAIGSYQAESSPSPYVVPYDDRYYPYYPGGYYDYYWGRPYVLWEWYVYDHNTYRTYRSRDHGRDHNRDRYRDRLRTDSWRLDEERPQGGGVTRDKNRLGGVGTHRGDNNQRSSSAPRSSTPRFRGPFQHR